MFWFILIALLLVIVIAIIGLKVGKEELIDEKDHPVISFIVELISFIIILAAVVATVASISAQRNLENENAILNDILKNETQPRIEYTIEDGDTILTDTYWLAPGESDGVRYPLFRKDSLGLK